ncbi:response regulator [bacterium]|nr:response regulator [bacterium]
MVASILLVDDDSTIGPLVQSITKSRPWEVTLASHGRDAIEKINARKPNLVITDLDMPVMNGSELTRQIVAQHADIPVVVLTGKGSEDSAVECFRAGAADYVRKENVKRDLVSVVAKLLMEELEADSLAQAGESALSVDHRESGSPEYTEPREVDDESNDFRIELEKDYIVRKWGNTVLSLSSDRGEDREFNEQKLRVLRRQAERLDKWSALANVQRGLRQHQRHSFADIVYLIPVDASCSPEISKRFAAFCRNVSAGGCSVIRNRILRVKEWAVFFPHLMPASEKPVCFRAEIVRDRPISMGMYEVSMKFHGTVHLPNEDVVLMMPRSQRQ